MSIKRWNKVFHILCPADNSMSLWIVNCRLLGGVIRGRRVTCRCAVVLTSLYVASQITGFNILLCNQYCDSTLVLYIRKLLIGLKSNNIAAHFLVLVRTESTELLAYAWKMNWLRIIRELIQYIHSFYSCSSIFVHE